MCAEYEIRTSKRQIEEQLERRVTLRGHDHWDKRIKLTNRAPIVYMQDEVLHLHESVFPVQPFPNARLSGQENRADSDLKRIYDRPTWRKPFIEERCLAVMNAFFEPAYWGTDAGSVKRFANPQGELIFIASIRIQARVPKGVPAHALLTHTATEQMLKYHHRMVVMLKPAHALAWISGGVADPIEKFDYLLKHRVVEPLAVSTDRKMAKGWEKRIEQHSQALESECAYVKSLAIDRGSD